MNIIFVGPLELNARCLSMGLMQQVPACYADPLLADVRQVAYTLVTWMLCSIICLQFITKPCIARSELYKKI